MIVRMVHPEHGATHVYDESELEKLKGFGWSVEGDEPVSQADDHLRLVKAALTQSPARKKPGPKPKVKQ
jgi:hypothetical protein